MTTEYIAGSLGGCAGVLVGHPFDTIKVRLQTQCALNPKYKGTWHCFTQTLRSESVRGLYKGMSSPMAGVSFINAIVFGIHGNIIRSLPNPDSIKSNMIAGAGAGGVQSFITSPMELVKTRMQIQTNSPSNALYRSSFDCLKTILKREGTKGVFRGQLITILREVPGFALYFGSYDFLTKKLSTAEGGISSLAILLSGGLAGTASWVMTYPIDVIKTRLQADAMEARKYRGMVHCLRSSVQSEGLSVLTRGLNSTIVRAFPTNAATFAVVSAVISIAEETEQFAEKNAWSDVIGRGEVLLSAAAEPITKRLYPTLLQHRKDLFNFYSLCDCVVPCVMAQDRESEDEYQLAEKSEEILEKLIKI